MEHQECPHRCCSRLPIAEAQRDEWQRLYLDALAHRRVRFQPEDYELGKDVTHRAWRNADGFRSERRT